MMDNDYSRYATNGFPYHQPASSHSKPFRQGIGEEEEGGRSFVLTDSITQYGLGIAIIFLIQFRGTWIGWIHYVRDRYRGLGILEILWDLFECAYAYLLAGFEMARTLLVVTSSAGLGLLEANDALPLERNVARRRRLSSASSMPELEDIPDILHDDMHARNDEPTPETAKPRKPDPDELEPAFLRDEDYPPGWMVYHPILGVVLKTEADNYKEKPAGA